MNKKVLSALGTAAAIFAGLSAVKVKKSRKKESFTRGQIKKQHKVRMGPHEACPLSFTPYLPLVEEYSDERAYVVEGILEDTDAMTLTTYLKDEVLDVDEYITYVLYKAFTHRKHHFLISLMPDVFEQVKALKMMDPEKKKSALLYGLPVLIKDNIEVEGLPTTAGAMAMLENMPKEDALLVKRLREQGAIILGKTNLSEWANFMTSTSANGYSTLGGQTLHPEGKFDVSGSSSGSAVAVALGVVPMAIGSETAGSIISPAAHCGVVGLKPTWGLLEGDGIIPLAPSFDVPGPMAASVADAGLMLSALTKNATNYHEELDDENVFKLGYFHKSFVDGRDRAEDQKLIKLVKKQLKIMGIETKVIKCSEERFEHSLKEVLQGEFKKSMAAYLYDKDLEVKSLRDIVVLNHENPSYTPYGQDLLEASAESDLPDEVLTNKVRRIRKEYGEALLGFMQGYGLDGIISIDNQLSGIYAPAGLPALTLPFGTRKSGEPYGVTIVGPRFSEGKLLQIGHYIEKNKA